MAVGVAILAGWEVVQFRRLSRLEARLEQAGASRPGDRRTARVTAQIDVDGGALKGDRRAPVALVVYSDFQCPYCTRFARDTLPELERRYVDSGQVLLVFKHLPLDSIHAEARNLAETAACAGAQDRFWPMHDLLFRRPPEVNAEVLSALADELRLDKRALMDCVKQHRFRDQIQADANEARRLGIQSTPASIIGRIRNGRLSEGELVRGARPLGDFTVVIDRVLEDRR